MSVPIVVRGGILVDNGTALPVDAFGRVRVSEPNTFMQQTSVSLLPTLRPQQLDVIVGDVSGAAGVVADISASTNVLSAGPGFGYAVRQTRQYIPYQAGKSRLVFISASLATDAAGLPPHVVSRVGIFDDHAPAQRRFGDGHFFELDGDALAVVERSSVSGTSQETRVPRSAWNGDRLGGAGPSKFAIDLGKMQLFWIDMEWLGVGEVRMGVVVGGTLVRCHTFAHANALAGSYTRTPKLPVRHEISASASAAAAGQMRMACSTVISEGGFVPRGLLASLGTAVTGTVNAGTTAAVLAVSLRPEGFIPRATLIPVQLDVIGLGNHPLFWQMRIDYSGLTTVSSWVNVDAARSAARYATNTSLAGGLPSGTTIVAEGSVLGRSSASLDFSGEQGLEGQPYLAATYNGVPDTLYITLSPLSQQNVDFSVCFRWQEIFV